MRRSMIALLAVALIAPAAAGAKAPPKGKYDCTIDGMLFDSVTIKSKGRYKRFDTTGKFVAKGTETRSDGSKANKIRFKTGPLKGFRGNWAITSSNRPQIALRNPLDDFESIYCGKAG
jgi:hypothetical protein